MGGSGSGGAGKTDWPEYMKTQHAAWLTAIASRITTVQAVNPWTPHSAYDPDADIVSMLGAVTDYLSFLNTVTTDTYISAAATAFDAALTATIDATTVARFEAGMRNINAVNSSAFAVGKAIIYAKKNEQVATFSAGLRLDAFLKLAEARRLTYATMAEVYKAKIIAKKEEFDTQMEIDVKEALWEIEIYKYGGNMLSSIGGASQMTGPTGPAKAQSAMGGAMMGAMVGGYATSWSGPGMAVGAVVGGIAGYIMAS